MKVIAYCALLYGRPYFKWAVRSVIEHVDEFHVLYSAKGSHNGNPGGVLPCPDSRADLLADAQAAAGNKLRWHDGNWRLEGEQRDSIYTYAPDADVILVVDADEIWTDEAVNLAVKTFHAGGAFRTIKHPLTHYWRSFYRAITDDEAAPDRVLFPKEPSKQALVSWIHLHHFGYAMPPAYTTYKFSGIHGHQAELRAGWLEDKYLANAQTDVHPTNVDYWHPVAVDPLALLPDFMRAHPYIKCQVIE